MVLQSYQKQVADLLSLNSSWVNPSRDHLNAAKYLSDLELITTQERYYIICSYKEDSLDWPYIIDPNCDNEIFIDRDFDEACDDLICESCGRYIFPNTYQKQRFHLLSVYLNSKKIIAWFERQLSNLSLIWQKTGNGVYYIGSCGSIVSLIVLDFCTNAEFLTIDRLKVHPTVLITLKENIPDLPLALSVVPIADLLCQKKTLTQVFTEAVVQGIPKLIANSSSQILPNLCVPLRRSKPLVSEKTLELQVKDGVVYINNAEIISKKAPSCFNIFQLLLTQYLKDFALGLSPEKHTLLSINKLEKLLNLNLEITDLEQQIRKPLNKMQRTIKEKLASKLGLNIERNDVIQTLGWPGSMGKEYGYRLNPFTLVLKKKGELKHCQVSSINKKKFHKALD